ncbi:MAG: MurR/RpiR family transcriptional regulator [Firmicutes bacterium]|nr:MurR/RpiR family transcriptional regulator [Bacillota bacterium]
MRKAQVKMHIQETLARMNSVLPSLRPAEQRVARLILENPRAAIEMSVTELAQLVDTSETTVIRLAKELGFKGLRELKMSIATELPSTFNIYDQLGPGETLEDISTTFFSLAVKAFSDTLGLLDLAELEKAIDALENAARIGCFGAGASGYVALDAQQKLLRVNLPAWSFVDTHEQLGFASGLTAKDAAIGISHSGYTKDTLAALSLARENGARTIAIVGDPRSRLAGMAEITLVAASTEMTFKIGTMISRLSQLAIVDLLTLGIASRRKELIIEQFDRRTRALSQRKFRPGSNSED